MNHRERRSETSTSHTPLSKKRTCFLNEHGFAPSPVMLLGQLDFTAVELGRPVGNDDHSQRPQLSTLKSLRPKFLGQNCNPVTNGRAWAKKRGRSITPACVVDPYGRNNHVFAASLLSYKLVSAFVVLRSVKKLTVISKPRRKLWSTTRPSHSCRGFLPLKDKQRAPQFYLR